MIELKKYSVVNRLVINALFAAISFWLTTICRYFTIPFLPSMFKFDISYVPIFMSTMLFGFWDGALALFAITFIRAIFFSSAGWTGFILRMINLIAVLLLSIYHKKNKCFVLYFSLASLLALVAEIPMSYFLWTRCHSMSPDFIKSIMWPIVIPYKLTRNIINILLAWLLIKKTKIFIK